jgi:putative glutamine amidotransferase
MQVLNVALGGTLVQDIANDDHWMREHTVDLLEGCKIAKAVGTLHLEHCHSVHHQGLDQLAPSLTACGWATDGQLEAVELPSASWIVGAQWHPEDTAPHKPQQQALYDELVRRAAARAHAIG